MTATVLAPLAPARPWVDRLARYGRRPALHGGDGVVTYEELADRVARVADRIGGPRRLVQVEVGRGVGTVAALLGAQAGGHAVLLGPPGDSARRLRDAYGPDVVVPADGVVDVVREEPAHDLHPELALLLSTSGSTGSPRLVRLSHANLAANTAQILGALDIRPDDCAALTLPLSYSYGLSVLHTHLAVGAGVLLPGHSVVDDGFWVEARAAGVTTIPGVPHTFELLERSGFADRELPRLRYLTQAGGRMEPERVRRLAELGTRRGWDLVVMYGQTEATARMTCLPGDLAVDHPDTVGRPVAGGRIDIEDGEVVFQGPNVMLGYADGPADLALGRTVERLHTGDLGELTPEGLLRVVGRRARFVKVLGHRVDLDALEARLRDAGEDVRCTGRDGLVVVGLRGPGTAPGRERLRHDVVRATGLPGDAVRVVSVDEHPTLPNGKADHAVLLGLAEATSPAATATARRGPAPAGSAGPAPSVAAMYAELLGRPVDDGSTFAGLDGDSLSYVEVSIRLEELLGHLPRDWHVTPVGRLEQLREEHLTGRAEAAAGTAPAPRPRARLRWQTIETSVWLRALAIVLIVGTHADVFTLQGTANALLVIAGYQLARLQLTEPDPRRRSRRVLRAARRVAVPTVVAVAGAHLVAGLYEPRNLVLANWALGEERLGPPWRFWFVEALVVGLVVVAALARSEVVGRWDRRYPLGLPLALTAVAFVAFRVPVLPLPVPRMQGSALVVLHLLLLGWALARARTPVQRLALSGVVLAVVMTFSWNHSRDGLTAAFVLLLLWVPLTKVPSPLVPVLQVLAASSLYVYVMHWQALEVLREPPLAALALSFAAGIAYWWLWTRPLTRGWRRLTAAVRGS